MVFFLMESQRTNLTSGNITARGMPGKPPPVPRSSTFSPLSGRVISEYSVSFLSLRYLAIAREWRTWWEYIPSRSFLEMTLILEFQSL